MIRRLAAAALIVAAVAWGLRAADDGGTVVVGTVVAPRPVVALRPAAGGGAVVALKDGRRLGLSLVAGRPILGPAADPVPPVPVEGWAEILRLAAHNDGRLDPIVVRDVDGDGREDWVALETAGAEARLLVLNRSPTGPVTVAFLDGVAGRSSDGALPVGLVDVEETGRPDILIAAADRRMVLRVRLWPGRLDVEEQLAMAAPVATAIVPLSPRTVALGLADGTIATVAWPGR